MANVALKAPENEAPKHKPIVALMNSATLFEQSNQFWRLVAREATPWHLEGDGAAAFYSVIQDKLRSFDRLAVITATHYYEVVILYSQRGCPVRAKILTKLEIPVVPEMGQPSVPDGYYIAFDPASQTYQGRRKHDDHPLTAPHGKWTDAFNELVNHAIFRK